MRYYSQPDLAWLSLAGSGFGNQTTVTENRLEIIQPTALFTNLALYSPVYRDKLITIE